MTQAKVNEHKYPRIWMLQWDETAEDGYGGQFSRNLTPKDMEMDTRDEPGEGGVNANESDGYTAEPQVPLNESMFLPNTMPDTIPLSGSAEEIPMAPIFQEGFTDDDL
ncbi:hypothetical protein MMC14_009511 [Varicellaria rhodocarpa]|nr:hypothetical protein [Varicellaria rhodocarpa]